MAATFLAHGLLASTGVLSDDLTLRSDPSRLLGSTPLDARLTGDALTNTDVNDNLRFLATRQETTSPSTTDLSELVNITAAAMAAWDTDTTAACAQSLARLGGAASNPSGTSICYNLPSLDTNTGVFMADLRLFRVGEPQGAFAGVGGDDFRIALSYESATAQKVETEGLDAGTPTAKRGEVEGTEEALLLGARQQAAEPVLLQTHMFVGQIDQEKMQLPFDTGILEAWVTPQMSVQAQSPSTGETVRTGVSSNEASFVSGVFANSVIRSDFAVAQAAVDDVMAQLEDGEVAFVLPGTDILIFPIGLVITCIWTVVGVAAYGFGTYERYGYRDSYRRRKARAERAPGWSI